MTMNTGGLTIAEWRERARAGLRKGTYDGLHVRVKRVWPNRVDVVFLDARVANEWGPAAPAGRVETVHPADIVPLPGLW